MKLVVAAAAVGAIGCLGLPTAGADVVGFTSPSGNIGCMTQLGGVSEVPVVHTVELLDWATGGGRPVGMETADG